MKHYDVVEEIAMKLHRFYRATFKQLHTGRLIPGQIGLPRNCIHEHDHGWKMCHRKKYFRRRAEMFIKEQYLERIHTQ